MKFISSWSVPQGTFNAAVARFLETGGAPPEGVKMLGRWHGMDGKGFAIPVDRHPLPGGRRRGRGDGVTTQALTFKSYRSHRSQSSAAVARFLRRTDRTLRSDCV